MDRVNQRENHLLGENIKRLRIEHNLRNCDVLAQLQLRGVDIARSTYSKIELGVNNPTVDLLIALADFYQVSFDVFFAEVKCRLLQNAMYVGCCKINLGGYTPKPL